MNILLLIALLMLTVVAESTQAVVLTMKIVNCDELAGPPAGPITSDPPVISFDCHPAYITQQVCGSFPIENLGELKLNQDLDTKTLNRGPAIAWMRMPAGGTIPKTSIYVTEVPGTPQIERVVYFSRVVCDAPSKSATWTQVSRGLRPTPTFAGTATAGVMAVRPDEIWYVMIINLNSLNQRSCPGGYCNARLSVKLGVAIP